MYTRPDSSLPRVPQSIITATVIVIFGNVWLMPDSRAGAPTGKAETAPQFDNKPAYLSIILQKGLLETRKEHGARLGATLKMAEALAEGGSIDAADVGQVRQQFLQYRIHMLRLEKNYQDLLDEHKPSGKELAALYKATLEPLMLQFQRLDTLEKERLSAYELMMHDNIEQPDKLRAIVLHCLTVSGLVKGTSLQQRAAAQWAMLTKLSAQELHQREKELRIEQDEIQAKRTKLPPKGKPLSEAIHQRSHEIEQQSDLLRLEIALRHHEQQPWKQEPAPLQKLNALASAQRVTVSASRLLNTAASERRQKLSSSWPEVPVAAIKGVNLLGADAEKAQAIVEERLKSPDVTLSARKNLRAIRTTAQIYKIQQDLFQIAFHREAAAREAFLIPGELQGLIKIDAKTLLFNRLNAQRSLVESKEQLIQTWIDYEKSHAALFRELN